MSEKRSQHLNLSLLLLPRPGECYQKRSSKHERSEPSFRRKHPVRLVFVAHAGIFDTPTGQCWRPGWEVPAFSCSSFHYRIPEAMMYRIFCLGTLRSHACVHRTAGFRESHSTSTGPGRAAFFWIFSYPIHGKALGWLYRSVSIDFELPIRFSSGSTMGYKPLQGKRFKDIKLWKNSPYTARHVAAPIVAFTMASLLFVYCRSSIYAAKSNAKRHREADGGQISWRNESARRHGTLEKPRADSTLHELLGRTEEIKSQRDAPAMTREEELLRAQKARRASG